MNESTTDNDVKPLQKMINAGIELLPDAGGSAVGAIVGFSVGWWASGCCSGGSSRMGGVERA